MPSSRSWTLRLAAALVLAGALGAGLWYAARRSARPVPAPPVGPGGDPVKVGVRPSPPPPPESAGIAACYLTQLGPIPYESLVRFEKVEVPVQEIPDWAEVAQAVGRQGRQLPATVHRVDRISNTLIENLSLPTRTLVSHRTYIHPVDGLVLAYDLAATDGGVPERYTGHLARDGVVVSIFRGGENLDTKVQPLPSGTYILPVTLDFIPRWLPPSTPAAEWKQGSFFVPEATAHVKLAVRRAGRETVAVRGVAHECDHFEVFTSSSKGPADFRQRSEMWFDARQGNLLRRTDYEPGAGPEELSQTELVPKEALASLQWLVLHAPPALPERPFPYPLKEDLTYRVEGRGAPAGRVRVNFVPEKTAPGAADGYLVSSEADIEAGGVALKEHALTRYDAHGWPVRYVADGEEYTDIQATHTVEAQREGANVRLTLTRRIHPPVPPARPAPPSAPPPPLPVATNPDDPLRRVPITESEERSGLFQGPRVKWHEFSRPLEPGTFFCDIHRVEQFALFAHRLLPAPGAPPLKPGEVLFRKVALWAVRTNQAAIATFAVLCEPLPATPAPPAETGLPPEPQLFLAVCNQQPMPCRMLLAPDGRLLQWSVWLGGGTLVYTLEDPIMQRREARSRGKATQEGPVLLRPSWF